MRRGVAVAAHDRGTGQGDTQFRTDDVDDTLPCIQQRYVWNTELGHVPLESLDLQPTLWFRNAGAAIGGGHVVVDHRHSRFRPADAAAGQAEALESLWARHLVNEMTIDIEDASAVLHAVYDVCVPNLVEQRARHLAFPEIATP